MLENALFLDGKVAEVGLCCFETASSLAWTEHDVPAMLAELSLRFHVHLPSDLPWHEGGAAAGAKATQLMEKLSFLHPRCAVLHLPHHGSAVQFSSRTLLHDFVGVWRGAGLPSSMLLLENHAENNLLDLEPDIVALNCGLCLDVGHMLAYGQEALLTRPALLLRVGLTHWSAPGTDPSHPDKHLPLTELSVAQRPIAREAAQLTRKIMPLIEVFHWSGIEASRSVLYALFSKENVHGFNS